jgi:hypothetical protein
MTILVRESTWEKIRAQFSEPEKVALRSSVCSKSSARVHSSSMATTSAKHCATNF